MEVITYQDFDLFLEPSADGYRVRVLNSPAGQASGSFKIPYSDLEIENFLLKIGRRAVVRRLDSSEAETARIFGQRLFESLFTGDVIGCFRSSLTEADRSHSGLRIRLRLTDAPELFDLPWEFLYDPTEGEFLVLSNKTPLVHYPELAQTVTPLKVVPPLSILVMISAPRDYVQLDVEKEWENLKNTLHVLEERGQVKLTRLEKATLPALQRQLRKDQYHIFHFVGHGGYDETMQDGLLLLEDDQGKGRPVSGLYLGTILQDHRSLRMVMLNACEGARTSRNDPFAGTAQSLIRRGIPAIIAMQFEITDTAALEIANEFYSSIADGYPVDASLAEARKALFAAGNELEWGTPVLYMRASDGLIFDVSQKRVDENLDQGDGSEDDRERFLEELYAAASEAFWAQKWTKAVETFQSIIDIRPDYRDVAEKLEKAKQEERLEGLYGQVLNAMEGENWQAALAALEKLINEAPDYRDATSKLEAVKNQKMLAEKFSSQVRKKKLNLPPAGTDEARQEIALNGTGGGPEVEVLPGPAPTVRSRLSYRKVGVPLWGWGILSLGFLFSLLGGSYLFLNRTPRLVSSIGMEKIPAGRYPIEEGQFSEMNAFWIDRYEVTNADYAKFVKSTGRFPPAYWVNGSLPPEGEDLPVRGIDFDTAVRYCRWAGKRLPSEAEWETAARGPFGWSYPWGESESAMQFAGPGIYPVGSLLTNRSYFGIYDLTGNVWEWVDRPFSFGGKVNVLRGGASNMRQPASFAIPADPKNQNTIANAGIRCAADESWVASTTDPDYKLEENFTDPHSGWPEVKNDRFIYEYHRFNQDPIEWYHMELREPDKLLPVFYDRESFRTFVVETEVYVDSKRTDNQAGEFNYGLAIRDRQGRLFAVVVSAHTHEWLVLTGELQDVAGLQPINGLKTLASGGGKMVNGAAEEKRDRLAIVADGQVLTFFVNGDLVNQLPDEGIQERQVGLVGETLQGVTRVHIHYDWIRAREVEPGSAVQVTPGIGTGLAETDKEASRTALPASETTPAAISEMPGMAMDTPSVASTPDLGAPATQVTTNLPSSDRMAKIDGGNYLVGKDETVPLPEFWMDRYEVTNAEYARFIDGTGGAKPASWVDGVLPVGKEDYPVQGIDWDTAAAYCKWAKKRLPSEAEWEAAARGPFGWLYPWGNQADQVRTSFNGTYPVGSLPANRSYFGVFDLAGNVWEWVDQPLQAVAAGQRVEHGGAHDYPVDMTTGIAGDPRNPINFENAGIRCAADAVNLQEDPNLLYMDPFNRLDSGWYEANFDPYLFGYHPPDFYHIQVKAPNACLSVVRKQSFDNFMIEAQENPVVTETQTGEFFYGLVLREQENRFYALVISPRTHTWRVLKHTAAGFEIMAQGTDEGLFNPVLQTPGRLFAIADGPELTFFVNGALVSKLRDSTYTSGNIGFVVRTEDETKVHIHFDSVSLWALPGTTQEEAVPETPRAAPEVVAPLCAGTVDSAENLTTYISHEVRPGETWISIAALYGVSKDDILKLNGRDPQNPGTLKIGDRLIIPKPVK